MNKILIIIFLAFIILVLILLLILPEKNLIIKKVCFNEYCFNVEVVDTPSKRHQGLMFRNNLEKENGMLFIFEKEDNYPFWMKDTLIPLDMIWINKNQEIVFIKENALPCQEVNCPSIDPNQQAKYVLEINGGISQKININIGDTVIFK